jgi:spermidine synthase
MRAIGQMFPRESKRSFSFLYTANVAGAVIGTALPLVLIELYGFHGTLRIGVLCNAAIAVTASVIAGSAAKAVSRDEAPGRGPERPLFHDSPLHDSPDRSAGKPGGERLLVLLLLTGLTSMGMEVVWVREFTPYVGTVVYAFASILAVYLLATFAGSQIYRRWSSGKRVPGESRSGKTDSAGTGSAVAAESQLAIRGHENPLLWTLLAIAALLPLITSSPNVHLSKGLRLIVGIMPFTGLLGFLTPMLIDRRSGGDPSRAGSAYAVNVAGCIVGPLLAGFALLPHMSERWALVALALPWLVVGVLPQLASERARVPTTFSRVTAYALLPVAAAIFLVGKGYDEKFADREVRRDSTATVIATGEGMDKRLLVNGYGMTTLMPVTKAMAHLPLAWMDRPPQAALDICFGMGTTFRSLLTWKIQVTAVELVPSVPKLFGYYHADGPELLRLPYAHVVADDGRRYLERTNAQYDLINIDPPPPVQAAGSSLLYSEEFYAVARTRLRPGGILQQWLPDGDAEDKASVAKALRDSFPNVRVFHWYENWGYLFLASDRPLPERSAQELAARLSPQSAADFVEWGPEDTAEGQFAMLLNQQMSLDDLIAEAPETPPMRDDRPINEYFALRWVREH